KNISLPTSIFEYGFFVSTPSPAAAGAQVWSLFAFDSLYGRLVLSHRVLLQFSWRKGSKDSRGQGVKGLFSNDFISAFNILSISEL
ncbi:MAG: hypothetical protein KJO34_07295, partial [Deltaproteobacteria bacterium]|nr:hypothetical protein [Deltaproteobacteria bacterium]